jgi:hypothetical protein
LAVAALRLAKRTGVPSSAGVRTFPLTLRVQVDRGSATGGERAAAAAAMIAESGCIGVTRTITRRPSAATEKEDAILLRKRGGERRRVGAQCLLLDRK